jgi:hypothetical protein
MGEYPVPFQPGVDAEALKVVLAPTHVGLGTKVKLATGGVIGETFTGFWVVDHRFWLSVTFRVTRKEPADVNMCVVTGLEVLTGADPSPQFHLYLLIVPLYEKEAEASKVVFPPTYGSEGE